MTHPALPAIAKASDKEYWESVGKILDGMTGLLNAQFPDDKGIRVSVKMLQGAVNGLIEAMTEAEKGA